MADTIKERLKQLAQSKELSIRAFEETCGLGRGNISNMSPDGSIGSDKLSKIIDTFPDCDIYWLLTGRGNPNVKAPVDVALSTNEQPLLDKLLEQAEEIGRLKAQIDELKRRRGDDAGDVRSSGLASVG